MYLPHLWGNLAEFSSMRCFDCSSTARQYLLRLVAMRPSGAAALTTPEMLDIVGTMIQRRVLWGAMACLVATTAEAQTEPAASEAPAPTRVLLVLLPLGTEATPLLEEELARSVAAVGARPLTLGDVSVQLPWAVEDQLARREAEAEQLELSLRLSLAAQRRRQVVELLEDHGTVASHPARLAQALARWASTEFEAGQVDQAVRLWRWALALQADLQLDGTFPPSAREAFDRARAQGPTLSSRPAEDILRRLCQELDLAAILWVATGHDNGQPTLTRLVYSRSDANQGEVRYPLLDESLTEPVTLPPSFLRDLQTALVRSVSSESTALVSVPGDPSPSPALTATAVVRPWWKQWWFYVTLGTLLAGAAVTVGLVYGLPEKEAEIVVHYPW
jgi:hypothetical protein